MIENNLFPHEDNQILHRRKQGQTLFEIYQYFQSCEPLLDSVIALNHVCRICYEHELSFTYSQIKKVFSKIHDPSTYMYQGRMFYTQCPKGDALKFLRSFSGHKKIIIKNLRKFKKRGVSLVEVGRKGVIAQDNSQPLNIMAETQSSVSSFVELPKIEQQAPVSSGAEPTILNGLEYEKQMQGVKE